MTQSKRMNAKSLAVVAGVMLVIAGSLANVNDASAHRTRAVRQVREATIAATEYSL